MTDTGKPLQPVQGNSHVPMHEHHDGTQKFSALSVVEYQALHDGVLIKAQLTRRITGTTPLHINIIQTPGGDTRSLQDL